jgi:hypothetical protein
MKCMKKALCQIDLFLRKKETGHGKWSLRVSIRENGFCLVGNQVGGRDEGESLSKLASRK